MTLRRRTFNAALRLFTQILFKVDAKDIKHVPTQGPFILACNHVNFWDGPVMLPYLEPRPTAVIAKAEYWKNPITRLVFNLWDGIPIRRGEADLEALKLSLDALKDDKVLVVAPEGTRSHDGVMQQGKPGIVLLALRSKAPVLPVAYWGNEQLKHNLRKFRRTPFYLRVGRPFRLNAHGNALSREVRQQMADEIMMQIAALLPEQYRGVYANSDKYTQDYIDFLL